MLVHEPDCIAVVETWTNSKIMNSELSIKGYDIIARKDGEDTSDGRGRGIDVYAKSGINSFQTEEPTSFSQAVEFKIAQKKCAVIYRSPNIGDQDSVLQNYLRTSGPFDLILGDFNLPIIDWKTQTSSTQTGETYVELFQDLFLHQHVEEPTHERGNVLDLVFTQDESFICT